MTASEPLEAECGGGPRGAYGLRITGVADARATLVDAHRQWPQLHIGVEEGDPPLRREHITDDRAEIILKTGGRLHLVRDPAIARYEVPRQLSDDELVHPFLAPAAAMMAHWLGRSSFHAGAFVSDGGAWAMIGDREAGKSSMLAHLAGHGHEIVADDILVVEDGKVYAGPRSIDLRRDTADRLGVGTGLGVVGTRQRWRVALPQLGTAAVPLRGWIFLAWTGGAEVRRLSGSECLKRLIGHIGLRRTASDPATLLQLATLPAWDFGRPRDWQLMDATAERLLSLARS
ncbi:MAG: hypothetical protein M3376_02180 [Actinomycetota bacterium]|nr:hypothetical protein [Actinomycetota bacterium]